MFIKINPDEGNFNIFKEINKVRRHIKKSTKKSLVDDLSKKLLQLEFKSNHSIKSKCLKWIVKKNTTHSIRHEKHTIENKTIKLGKNLEQHTI